MQSKTQKNTLFTTKSLTEDQVTELFVITLNPDNAGNTYPFPAWYRDKGDKNEHPLIEMRYLYTFLHCYLFDTLGWTMERKEAAMLIANPAEGAAQIAAGKRRWETFSGCLEKVHSLIEKCDAITDNLPRVRPLTKNASVCEVTQVEQCRS